MGEKCLKNRGDYVFDTLKKEILKLELKPGQAISENEICARFDVSRTPVREALRRLQEQGFVRTVPYSGTYVTLLNLDDIRQMIYMRIAVELKSGRAAPGLHGSRRGADVPPYRGILPRAGSFAVIKDIFVSVNREVLRSFPVFIDRRK